ncbi:MAG: hypothetical protein HY506_00605 [Candidatus Yanofskybacteria bacterium]|nr:hypothetical protein [Candidatus Yanofskybacteria bacterium]
MIKDGLDMDRKDKEKIQKKRFEEEEAKYGKGERARMELSMLAFDRVRDLIYSILPEDCLLKPEEGLAPSIITSIHKRFLDLGWYDRQDVCTHCDREECKWFGRVSYKKWRVIKIAVLSFVAKISETKSYFYKFLVKQEVKSEKDVKLKGRD